MALSGSFARPDQQTQQGHRIPKTESPLPWVRALSVVVEVGGLSKSIAIAVGQSDSELKAYLELWVAENRARYVSHRIDTVPYVGKLGNETE